MNVNLPPELEAALLLRANLRNMTLDEIIGEVLSWYAALDGDGIPEYEDEPNVDFSCEQATYERYRTKLETEHPDKVALIRGDELVGVFDSWEAAGAEGTRRFGLEKFMIKDIGEPVVWMPLALPPRYKKRVPTQERAESR